MNIKKRNKRKADFAEISKNIKSAVTISDSDPLSGIVCFFENTSKLEGKRIINLINEIDSENHHENYHGLIERLRNLQAHIVQTGYNKLGINRTLSGQKVTEHTIFLGNNGNGLAPNSVYFWKSINGSHADTKNTNDAKTIVSQQAKSFIESHAKEMTETIDLFVNSSL